MKLRAIVVCLTLGLYGCQLGPLCGNSIQQRLVAPDGRYQAIAFIRDCGATTSESSQVAILRTGKDLGDRGGNVVVLEDSPTLSIEWVSKEELRVTYSTSAEVFKREEEVNGIRISYAVVDSGH
jgi:hypothetical protein